jgi:16S rRNA U516 pseudouridylate synthase RsuA-like enzyme
MENERFNMSLRKFLKHVGITSQQEIERVVRENKLAGKGRLKVKMVLTAEGTDLRHEVADEIDLG